MFEHLYTNIKNIFISEIAKKLFFDYLIITQSMCLFGFGFGILIGLNVGNFNASERIKRNPDNYDTIKKKIIEYANAICYEMFFWSILFLICGLLLPIVIIYILLYGFYYLVIKKIIMRFLINCKNYFFILFIFVIFSIFSHFASEILKYY